jgi:hypothetical protein
VDATADEILDGLFRQRRERQLGEGALERERDFGRGVNEGAVEIENDGADGLGDNRLTRTRGDSMQAKWLVAAVAAAILTRPALAETVTVVTSFPKELTEAYKKAYEKKYPNDKVEVLNKGTSAGIAYVREQPAGSRVEIFWVSAPDAFEVLACREAAAEGRHARGRHSGEGRRLPDQRPGGLLPRPGARGLRP